MSEYKIVVVGSGGVGKSAITVRLIKGDFIERYDPTIEDSYRKQIEVDGAACMLDIMDTAGQEEYSGLRDQYMKNGEGFIVVYSITSEQSFDAAKKLYLQIQRMKEDFPIHFPIMVVANKLDLESERTVSVQQGRSFATDNHCGFCEVSAKTFTNITESFTELVRLINKWREANPNKSAAKKKKSGCSLL
eukprot:TRINITY_DN17688_c0_g1_i1.p1 TRINITY_DN17688_c0_g1~~TRINITY_DN17688_c0_g1_i1.p1  ORF type:complete len:190 (-),score=31.43 TRINITY_DN17688_c0_g1_i1:154-723(-)